MNILSYRTATRDCPECGAIMKSRFECLFCGCEWNANAGEYFANTRTAKATMVCPECGAIMKPIFECLFCGAIMESRLETAVVDVEEVTE